MSSHEMKSARVRTRGFTLIASLLLLLLLSGIAIGLMMMVNTEGKVGSTDLQNNAAYHVAEGGIEKMTSDLAATFNNAQAPTAAQICNIGTMQPTMVGVVWKYYQVTPGALGAACPASLTGLTQWGQISSGPNQGLWAQIIPVSMQATADEAGAQEVSMMRSAQVALIPVFQFGVFSDSDLAFFPGSNLDFAGPVHTNGDLYPLAGTGATVTFHAKLSAFGNVVRTQLPNGWPTSSNYTGTVYIPSADGDCTSPGTPVTGNCTAMAAVTTNSGDGSVTGAGSTTAQSGSNYNGTYWTPFSNNTHSEIINGNFGSTTTPGTGAKQLSLPFVGGGALPNEIIRRPQAGESATSAVGASREYNLAQIHVLLSDDPADLPGGAADTANNIRLANVPGTYGNQYGIATSLPSGLPGLATGNTYNTYFAAASNAVPLPSTCTGTFCTTADWPYAPAAQSAGTPNPSLQPAGAPIFLNKGIPTISLCPPAGVTGTSSPAPTTNCQTGTSWTGAYPYYALPNANGSSVYNSASSTAWNLIDGWLRVEYKDASGNWHPVTTEWLQLGFARGLTPPTTPGSNPYHPNAILLLQAPADRDASGAMNSTGTAPVCNTWNTSHTICLTWTAGVPPEVAADTAALGTAGWWQYGITSSATATQSITQYNWYPINFYDVREGEVRDTAVTDNSCTSNGVMNAVEIDVGNLNKWLKGTIGTSGTSVDYVAQNGYVLYFSDLRGMLYNPNAPYSNSQRSGDAGLEDVINSSSAGGMPDGNLDPVPTGRTYSPEDVNENSTLDNWGTSNMGLGQWNSSTVNLNAKIIGATPDNPYSPRITSCSTTGRKNWVSGARHVLKLVDGSFGNIPHRTDAGATLASPGGFTVASENPVYIQGDYNTNSSDWAGGVDETGHAAASVIADAVTLLSDDWDDRNTYRGIVTALSQRNPSHDGYYRVAIAGGKNMAFPQPSGTAQDFGTDGGLHNFLRYLEDWSGQTVHYKGSLVSLFYATYDTGIFKCCTTVYGVPSRDYVFDSDFSTPGGLPPGTPMFRDVNSLGYRQLFTPRTN
jgi:Tfp pilus assembly protein PilX